MRPATLRPGDEVLFDGRRRFRFVRRIERVCWFQCDQLKGLNGPDDNGLVTVTDADVSRRCEPAAG